MCLCIKKQQKKQLGLNLASYFVILRRKYLCGIAWFSDNHMKLNMFISLNPDGSHISLFPPQRDRLCKERGGTEKKSRWKRQVVQGAAGELAEQSKTAAQKTNAYI